MSRNFLAISGVWLSWGVVPFDSGQGGFWREALGFFEELKLATWLKPGYWLVLLGKVRVTKTREDTPYTMSSMLRILEWLLISFIILVLIITEGVWGGSWYGLLEYTSLTFGLTFKSTSSQSSHWILKSRQFGLGMESTLHLIRSCITLYNNHGQTEEITRRKAKVEEPQVTNLKLTQSHSIAVVKGNPSMPCVQNDPSIWEEAAYWITKQKTVRRSIELPVLKDTVKCFVLFPSRTSHGNCYFEVDVFWNTFYHKWEIRAIMYCIQNKQPNKKSSKSTRRCFVH